MSKAKPTGCRKCGGELEIQGTGGYGNTIVVECTECGEGYEVEPDGLNMSGEEMIIAMTKQGGY